MANRFIDWLTGLTAKSTTIDGTEITHIGSSGLSQKALLSDVIRYGGGNSTRVTTIGNANIHQKSDGTMWLEVTGQTAGNARGAGAFDWQAVRDSAAKIASGANSFAFGSNSTASGTIAIAIGNTCNATQTSATAIGAGNTASNVGAVALGLDNVSSGLGAAALGGRYASASNIGQIAFGSGHNTFWVVGGAQSCIQNLFRATTDASVVALSTDGTATDRMVIPAMRACAITGLVTAMSDATDGYKVKAWEIKAVITRDNSNNTRIVGTPIITELGADTEAAGWAITSITADNTNESLSINVTGEAATNIRWQASLFYSQVGH